ncbi:MAG: hypothetical protein IJG13_13275, partial [Kiritimatiellae bacterium]|nr:hypothetical protein [Kiritimatiellia bacterium]
RTTRLQLLDHVLNGQRLLIVAQFYFPRFTPSGVSPLILLVFLRVHSVPPRLLYHKSKMIATSFLYLFSGALFRKWIFPRWDGYILFCGRGAARFHPLQNLATGNGNRVLVAKWLPTVAWQLATATSTPKGVCL